MTFRRLARHAREAWEVPRDLVLGRYPPFVTGGPLPRGHVPVFVFHSLEPESFGRKLQYLADNGYVSLSADEYLQVLAGACPAPERAVVLTFDDGRGSLWSVGLPLMRRHGMKGIAFVVPGRTVSRPGPPAPTWDDVCAGKASAAEVLGRERGETAFLSWEEIEALSRSGLVDVQSHTFLHARVHTAPRLAGFMSPSLREGYSSMDVPLIQSGEGDLLAAEVPLGTPLFRSEPRTSEALRFHEEAAVREACVRAVAEGGGEEFFRRRGWERRLGRIMDGRSIPGRLETPAEREKAILRELKDAREILEKCVGRPVTHLCYPWHVSGPTARRLAREVGYRTAFFGKVPGVPITLPGGEPHAVARIGEDYLELLPGRGRASLASTLRRKWSRRLRHLEGERARERR